MCFVKNYDVEHYRIDYAHIERDHDVQCYKIMRRYDNGVLHSIPFHFPYEIGETYESEVRDIVYLDSCYSLNEFVYHSYHDQTWARRQMRSLSRPEDYVLVSCVIPANTPFWHNKKFHEYASMAIKIVGIVED